MTFIDAHVHLGSWPTLRESMDNVLLSMERYRIDYSLLSNADAATFPSVYDLQEDPRSALEHLRNLVDFVKEHPGKLGALVWIKPQREPEPSPELKAYVHANKQYIFGLKLHPYDEKTEIDDPILEPYWAWAKEEGFPILVHTAFDPYSSMIRLGEVAKRHRDLTFIAAHMELCSDNEIAFPIMRENPNIYADTAWVRDEIAMRAIAEFGEDRILFGTDNPIDGVDTLANPMYQDYFHNRLGFTASQYQKLFRDNAIAVYKLPIK